MFDGSSVAKVDFDKNLANDEVPIFFKKLSAMYFYQPTGAKQMQIDICSLNLELFSAKAVII